MLEQWSGKFAVGTILLFGMEVLALITLVNIVMKARSATSAWGWGMSVLAFPFVAMPLYWILGGRTFPAYVKKLRLGREENQHLMREIIATLRPCFAKLSPVQAHYGEVLEHLSDMRFAGGNEVCLLIDGKNTFDTIFEAVENAERYVLVQFFIVRDDDLGRRFRDLLVKKAGQDVKVHFLYDEIGCYGLPKHYLRSLSEAGIEVSDFHSTLGPSNRFQINFRNHRKIVVVDGRVAFAGGHNVGDEYMGNDPRVGRWRDTHVQVTGPAVFSLQLVFLGDWYWATGSVPEMTWDSTTQPRGMGCGGENMTVLALPTGPVDLLEGGTMFFLNAITRSRERLWMASPYFVTDESVRYSLQLAALRGVDVRIMLPENPDKWIPWLASFAFIGEMEAAGVKVYRYGDGFLHQKVILVDDQMASVGTANLDNRSMRLNFEVSMVVLDETFAAGVASMLETDFGECRQEKHSDFLNRPWWFRLLSRLARLAAPVL